MSFKGTGGARRLGIAIGCSVVVHIVAFCVFVMIGAGGGKDAEPSSAPPPLPPPDEVSPIDQPAAVADTGAVTTRAEEDRLAAEAAAKPKPAAAKPAATKPAKPKPAAAKPESPKPAAAKPEQPKPETAKPAAAKPEQTAKKPDQAKPAAAETEAEGPKGEWKTYEVRPGDSLTKLARKCGCTVHELAKANGLKPDANLNLGQKIKIKAE